MRIALDEWGRYQAEPLQPIGGQHGSLAESVCPFSSAAANEDEIGCRLYGQEAHHDHRIGYWRACYAGHVSTACYRANGSSGGFVSWLLVQMVEQGLVDAIAHVLPWPREDPVEPLFRYSISRTADEVRSGSKSRYYPVEMSQVLATIRSTPGTYAVVGLPCFAKAVRLLADAEPVLRDRVAYVVSLFCGHLKTVRFGEFLAAQMGVKPSEVASIDFRRKLADRPADDYAVEVITRRGESLVSRACDLFGYDWGLGFFRCSACDYCDDVVGETADISVGDAWLPEYTPDSGGTNVVVVRSAAMADLVTEGIVSGALSFRQVGPDSVARSQTAGLRHRREGLSYRLWLADRAGQWRPPKRVGPDPYRLDAKFRRIHRARMELASESHHAWARSEGKPEQFAHQMAPMVRRYREYQRWEPWPGRAKAAASRVFLAGARYLQGTERRLRGIANRLIRGYPHGS
ncbi:MAG TPA: Coenzyme F420 hydrogenase/dehydrogenase, beta subunit C-terminal domain [Chthonomonadales bacterium]|nr:Coenzyme F420 hydrogenase/dehydrogenase, beta subunit C-terminal domain [Chthonomonadales bacterium]